MAGRTWTPEQRLLTQLVTIPVYFTQAVVPGWCLSIEHDLLGQWRVGPLAPAWWLALGGLFAYRRAPRRLLAAWLLLLALEASPANLDLMFDHRTYAANLFLLGALACLGRELASP